MGDDKKISKQPLKLDWKKKNIYIYIYIYIWRTFSIALNFLL